MTTTHEHVRIRPIPSSAARSTPHEHAWLAESQHPTSDGDVLYVRCACGARRIDLQARADAPPAALTAPIVRSRPRG